VRFAERIAERKAKSQVKVTQCVIVCGALAPTSVLRVYYDKICLKFASHHFLLYAVYNCQKSLNFYSCRRSQMLPAKM